MDQAYERAKAQILGDSDATRLNFNLNQLTALPPEIGQLTNLQQLYLNGNQLTDLPPEIGQLTNLQQLYLDDNQLTALPPEIGQLTNLLWLDVDCNQLTALPHEIGQLTNLQQLYLHDNQLTDLPPEVCQLTNLEDLKLHGNQLTDLPPEIGQLTNLQQLWLNLNQLTDLPPEIGQLTNLQQLYLNLNQLTDLPPEIGQLTNLQQLWLSDNQLTALPPEIGQLTNLQELDLDNNQLNPELEVAYRSGLKELQKYLVRLSREGEALFEAKLLLVGEGEVGKSSLLATLRDEDWVDKRDSTHGLEIKDLELRHPDKDALMTLRAWDFGGQPVYRPTHQLFFTAPALYLVVWKPRAGSEPNFVEYWIKLIRHRAGPNARIIVVATHRSENRLALLDEEALKSSYPGMIADFHHVDSHDRLGIGELTELIRQEAARLDGMGRAYPSSWRKARELIKSLAAPQAHPPQKTAPDPIPYLSYSEFEQLLSSAPAGLDRESAASFAGISHELGQLVHYADDPNLAELVVLRPDWWSRAISWVLEDAAIHTTRGLVSHSRLAELWNTVGRPDGPPYPAAVHSQLLRLMERFDISYRVALPSGEAEHASEMSLIGQMVPPASPDLKESWDDLVLSGRSELTQVIEIADSQSKTPAAAEGLPYQLIVRLHRFSLGRNDYRRAVHWQSGMVLDDRYNGRALVTMSANRVQVQVRAALPTFFLHQLTEEIRWLIEHFWKGLEARRKVSCPDCRAGLFDIEHLMQSLELGRAEQPCPSCNQWKRIGGLLIGASTPQERAGDPSLLSELHREMSVRFDHLEESISAGFEKSMTKADEYLFVLLRTQDDQAEHGPRLFTLAPAGKTWTKPGWLNLRFVLTLHCEHSRLPLYALGQDPSVGVYELEMPREWVVKAAPWLRWVAAVAAVALPVAKQLAEVEIGAPAWRSMQARVDSAHQGLIQLEASLTGAAEYDPDDLRLSNQQDELSGAVLRQLHEVLKERDPAFGGLEKVRNNKREPLWVHPRFVKIYSPDAPRVQADP